MFGQIVEIRLMTSWSYFTSGNTTMTSAEVDFFKRAKEEGMIVVQSGCSLQPGENVYASSECWPYNLFGST